MVPGVLEKSVVESVQRIQADLAGRVAFEQSCLRDVCEWVGFEGGGELFNTYVNILSGEEEMRDTSPSEELFAPLKVAEPPPSSQPPPTTETKTKTQTAPSTLTALDISYLAEHNLYLDIVRNRSNDCIDFGLKCSVALMGEGQMRAFALAVGGEVGVVCGGLGGGG